MNRLEGKVGFCKTARLARVASFGPHFGEETPLVGQHGSGTVFLSSCNLLCSFCQNYEISHENEGSEVQSEQLADMMMKLSRMGCHNINFVTPSHVVPQLIEALVHAVPQGLNVPLVYNSSGYDKKETLRLLDGIFDIYMPDFKFWDGRWADRYCGAPDYPAIAGEALREMHRQVGDLALDHRGIATKGLLVRHLVMPHRIGGTREIMNFVADEISPNTYVNIMDQYRPCGDAPKDEFIRNRLSTDEFRDAQDSARRAGIIRLDQRDQMRRFFRTE